jgi:hypothetical protein
LVEQLPSVLRSLLDQQQTSAKGWRSKCSRGIPNKSQPAILDTMTLTPYSAFLLLPAMIVLLQMGHALRLRRKDAPHSSAIEGAVFGLFGLLLAFTFSGAVARYDAHRQLVLQEGNNIGTAYLRLDLLRPQDQPPLRQLFRSYVTSRLHLYDKVGDEISDTTKQLQQQIWTASVTAAAAPGASPDATKLLLPAVNDMIDITSTRQNAFNMHPPSIIFLLLFVLSGGCAFVAGYGMEATQRSWFYTTVFAFTVTLTIYATLEIEFPRQGIIRLTHADDTFLQLRDSIH